MSLEKAIYYGKEKRKPYYKSERFDWTCRPGGVVHIVKEIDFIQIKLEK